MLGKKEVVIDKRVGGIKNGFECLSGGSLYVT